MPGRVVRSCAFLVFLLAAAAGVRAAPVAFDNTDGTFRWQGLMVFNYHLLDVRSGPATQPPLNTNRPGPHLAARLLGGGHTGYSAFLSGTNGLAIASVRTGNGVEPLLLTPSDEVGPRLSFGPEAVVDAHYGYGGLRHTDYTFPGGPVGVAFPLADGTHYGFVQWERYPSAGLQPVRWGYESEPGVPFPMSAVVPEPAAFGLLALTSCVLLLRRRRACACAFAVLLLAGSPRIARAVPVVHDNTAPQYRWGIYHDWGPVPVLGITRGAGDQPGDLSVPGLLARPGGRGHTGFWNNFHGTGGLQIAVAGDKPRALSSSDVVGPAMSFAPRAMYQERQVLIGVPPVEYLFTGFAGVSFPINNRTHYGFVLFGDRGTTDVPQPLRWGYESEPGVPFAMSAVVPEPGTLSLLGVAGCVMLRRRRSAATPVS